MSCNNKKYMINIKCRQSVRPIFRVYGKQDLTPKIFCPMMLCTTECATYMTVALFLVLSCSQGRFCNFLKKVSNCKSKCNKASITSNFFHLLILFIAKHLLNKKTYENLFYLFIYRGRHQLMAYRSATSYWRNQLVAHLSNSGVIHGC